MLGRAGARASRRRPRRPATRRRRTADRRAQPRAWSPPQRPGHGPAGPSRPRRSRRQPGAEAGAADVRHPREDFFLDAAAGDDFVGVQATRAPSSARTARSPSPTTPSTLTGWEYFPQALGDGVRNAWADRRRPGDRHRERHRHRRRHPPHRLHPAARSRAAPRGSRRHRRARLPALVAARQLRVGRFRPTFGLVAWDRETFERTPKPSLRGSAGGEGERAHRLTRAPAASSAATRHRAPQIDKPPRAAAAAGNE